jgi:hypothetical protein
MTTP